MVESGKNLFIDISGPLKGYYLLISNQNFLKNSNEFESRYNLIKITRKGIKQGIFIDKKKIEQEKKIELIICSKNSIKLKDRKYLFSDKSKYKILLTILSSNKEEILKNRIMKQLFKCNIKK